MSQSGIFDPNGFWCTPQGAAALNNPTIAVWAWSIRVATLLLTLNIRNNGNIKIGGRHIVSAHESDGGVFDISINSVTCPMARMTFQYDTKNVANTICAVDVDVDDTHASMNEIVCIMIEVAEYLIDKDDKLLNAVGNSLENRIEALGYNVLL